KSAAARAANAALPGHIVGATDWLQEIWQDRAAFCTRPALVLWGAKDIAFRTKELDRWRSELTHAVVHEFADCGHFVAEEAPERVLAAMRAFLG
ncbi:MAG: alpha/beta fold hydrolase, partial [Acidimicrobiaceae bacterium]|nr:alpha/beta fold hydrolase [Acidimicrobiaceae bacterium]